MILFACLPLPTGITRDLVRLQKGVSGARWREPDQFHITLGYFGEVDDDRAEDLDRELASKPLPPLRLRVRGAGHYGTNPPHSLWMGVELTDGLEKLHAHVRHSARRARVDMDRRQYRPHVTMAYLRDTVDVERVIRFEQRLADFESPPILFDEMHLWSSHRRKSGPNLYRVEATYPMVGGAAVG